jgi:hypothetical protein
MTPSTTARHRPLILMLGALLATLAGCGPRGPVLGQVSGTVTLDGRPLDQGTIIFEATGLRPATARILDGRIVEATTNRPNDGVPVGHQRIAVFSRAQAVVADPRAPSERTGPGTAAFPPSMGGRSLLPARYNDPATSGLSATIQAGSNSLSLELHRHPP